MLNRLKYAVSFLFVVHAFANANCCDENERSTSYLDVAIDLISKAKNSMPECEEKEESPKVKECPETKKCPEMKECPELIAMDCADWYERGHNKSGVYYIRPINRLTSKKSLKVFCDMDTEGRGWTVIQRRGNFGKPDDYFYKDWSSYKEGFGDVDKEFWLGNDNIFALTNQKPYSIRFDMQNKNLTKAYAKYSDFWIEDELRKYRLHIADYSGNAGDRMKYHDNINFSAKDQKNDASSHNCAVKYKSAWWFINCHYVNLNGIYNDEQYGVNWNGDSLRSLIWAEMKIRPKMFNP